MCRIKAAEYTEKYKTKSQFMCLYVCVCVRACFQWDNCSHEHVRTIINVSACAHSCHISKHRHTQDKYKVNTLKVHTPHVLLCLCHRVCTCECVQVMMSTLHQVNI